MEVGIPTGRATPGKSGTESNNNEEVFHTPQISRTWASPLDTVSFHT